MSLVPRKDTDPENPIKCALSCSAGSSSLLNERLYIPLTPIGFSAYECFKDFRLNEDIAIGCTTKYVMFSHLGTMGHCTL